MAEAPSATGSAATVSISAPARGRGALSSSDTTGSLEGAIVDTLAAKYAFIANLKVLQTGDEMSNELTKLGQKS